MKRAALTVAVVLLAVAGAKFRRWHHPAGGIVGHSPTHVVQDRTVRPDHRRSNSAIAMAVSAGLDRTLATVHRELQYWQSHVTGDIAAKDAEAELSNRLLQLEACLTEGNTAAIVRDLSQEELDSPFGVAALRRWLSLDPAAAARWVAGRSDADDTQAFLVADTLIVRPADLLDFCRELPDTPWKAQLVQHAAGAALTIDPRAAAELSRYMAPSDGRTELLGQIAEYWVRSEPEAAMTWTQSISDPVERDSTIVAAATTLVSSDPVRALDWLTRNVQDAAVRRTAVQATIAAWGATDLDTAARWVESLADPELRAAAAPVIANLQAQRTL